MCMYVNVCGISLAMQCIKDSCQSKQSDVSDAPYEFSACISHYNSASVLILRLYLCVPGITSSECVLWVSVEPFNFPFRREGHTPNQLKHVSCITVMGCVLIIDEMCV